MQILISLIPLILLAIFYLVTGGLVTAYTRLASSLLLREPVSWKSSFMFAAAVIVLTLLGRIVSMAAGFTVPFAAALAINFALFLVLGGWLFRNQGVNKKGQPSGWPDGMRTGALSFLFTALTALLLYGAFSAL